jgi:hypothetical protein
VVHGRTAASRTKCPPRCPEHECVSLADSEFHPWHAIARQRDGGSTTGAPKAATTGPTGIIRCGNTWASTFERRAGLCLRVEAKLSCRPFAALGVSELGSAPSSNDEISQTDPSLRCKRLRSACRVHFNAVTARADLRECSLFEQIINDGAKLLWTNISNGGQPAS